MRLELERRVTQADAAIGGHGKRKIGEWPSGRCGRCGSKKATTGQLQGRTVHRGGSLGRRKGATIVPHP
ncbi:MAG: hypothetical protein R3B96_11270 [Pirellulaceae bacterium]